MIDLRKNIAYKRAKLALAKLNDAQVWIDTFSNAQLKQQILDWIRNDQLKEKGVNADGDVIGYYSFVTSLINPEKVFNTPYTLDDTGDFYRSMVIITLSDVLIIRADTEKMEDQEWFTERIIELTDENIQNLRTIYKKKLQDYARNVLLGR